MGTLWEAAEKGEDGYLVRKDVEEEEVGMEDGGGGEIPKQRGGRIDKKGRGNPGPTITITISQSHSFFVIIAPITHNVSKVDGCCARTVQRVCQCMHTLMY